MRRNRRIPSPPVSLRVTTLLVLCGFLAIPGLAKDKDIAVLIQDSEGLAGEMQTPMAVEVELPERLRIPGIQGRLCMVPVEDRTVGDRDAMHIPVQFQPDRDVPTRGSLLWMAPEGLTGERTFLLKVLDRPQEQAIFFRKGEEPADGIDLSEGSWPVLRYHYTASRVPRGIDPVLARGDYVSALHGPNRELLTEDYPVDHPHHRGLNWSWATIEWKGQTRDLFAVRGIWSRPSGQGCSLTGGSVAGVIDAECEWMWDDTTSVVRERVVLRAFRATPKGRAIDVVVHLTARVEGLRFCGRLEAGYSGVNVRMSRGEGQEIVTHNDPEGVEPRRSWADFSATFGEGLERSGLAILQNEENPGYPGEWIQYPELNFFQPSYPGGQLVPLSLGQTVVLQYRLWIHPGGADRGMIEKQWNAYNRPPSVIVTR